MMIIGLNDEKDERVNSFADTLNSSTRDFLWPARLVEPLCFHQAIGKGRQAIDSDGTVTRGPLFSTLNVVVPCSPMPPMRWRNNRKRGSPAVSPRLKLGGIPSPLGVCYWRTGGTGQLRSSHVILFYCSWHWCHSCAVPMFTGGRPWRCRLHVTTQSVPFSLNKITQCNRKDRTSEQDTTIGGDLYA